MADRSDSDDFHGRRDPAAIAAAEAAHVFVSYASPDAAVAVALVEALERRGIACWMAPRDVKAGALYADAIIRAISGAKALVLVLSESAIRSSHVGKEIERASSKQRPIIALRIDNAQLTPAFEYFLSESQWVEAQADDKEPAYRKLMDAILEPHRAAPGIPPPATRQPGTGRARLRNRILLAAALAVVAATVGTLCLRKFWPERHTAADAPAISAAGAVRDNSIAVLPFSDMSEKKDQEYFSDGLSEELIDLLSKISALHVPARTSSFYFEGKQATIADIAKALGVSHVLEGSVRRSGNTLRVTAQLIRADTGFHMWSETYDRQLDDVFKVQDEIAAAVVAALRVKLLSGQTPSDHGTTSSEAYDEYLIGRHLLSQDNWAVDRIAAENFRKAVELDPNYAAAWADLAEAEFTASGDCASGPECVAGAEQALISADRAIALRPDLADGYSARGYVQTWGRWNFAGAAEDFKHALALEPENSEVLLRYAHSVLMPNGRLDEGIAAEEKALKTDPLNGTAWRMLGIIHCMRGDTAAARSALQRSLEISPQQSNTAAFLAYTFLVAGDPASALAISQRAAVEMFRLQGAALAEHDLGHAPAAEQRLDDVIAKYAGGAAFQIAQVYAWWGEKDKAFEWLERAYLQHDGGLTALKVDPLLKNLRSDPRYKTILQKMKLPP